MRYLHCPLPLHTPVVPHSVPSSVQLSGSVPPLATLAHVPAVFAQVWQVPQLAVEQQVPSTQCFDVHWSSAVHEAPSLFKPQVPMSHVLPGEQSAELVQIVRQSLVRGSHLNVPHGSVLAV